MGNSLGGAERSSVLLSIITVTHNDADRLLKTIQSLTDFYGDPSYEHIIIDGGSVDDTERVVSVLDKTPNFSFYSSEDEGIYDAMNRGVEVSCGKYMLFLNCGDCMLITPDRLGNQLRKVDNERVDIVCFSFTHLENRSSCVVTPLDAISYKMPTSHQGMVFSSGFVRAHLYDTRYKIAADYDLYLHAKSSQVVCAPMLEPLTAVEIKGVASNNPVVSYKEYLVIAYRNLHGINMLACLMRIGFKAMFVIALKHLLSQFSVKKRRSKE